MDDSTLKFLGEFFETRHTIAILTHANPDGDAIGSSLGLYHYLTAKGQNVSVIVPNDYPDFLAWMPGCSNILIHKRKARKCLEELSRAELVFCLDFNTMRRVEQLSGPLQKSGAVKILIDHHIDPENGFDHILSRTDTSSASELVYDLIMALGDRDKLDKNAAECIYAGIMTDTGSFSYACNHESTYHALSHLMSFGIDAEHIHRLVYDTFSESRMKLLGYCLSEKMTVLHEFRTAWLTLTKADLKRFNFVVGDTEGIVNYPLSIRGILMSGLFIEREGHIKISLRSKGDFSVNEVVRSLWEGGGHLNAAGGYSYKSLEETVAEFSAILPKFNKLRNS